MTLSFSEPLWLLLVLPAAALLLWHYHRLPAAFSVPSLSLLPLVPSSLRRWRAIPGCCYGLATVLLIVALAGPELRLTREVPEDGGLDLVVLLDLSGSMAAGDWPAEKPMPVADDVWPETAPPGRVVVAREAIAGVLAALPAARVALVAFAGRPYLVCPLVRHHRVLLERLAQLSPAQLDDGTAIGQAIQCGLDALPAADAAAPGRPQLLLLFSDGADHTSAGVAPEAAALAAAVRGVVLHSVGIGGARGLHPVTTASGCRWEAVGEELDADQLRRLAAATGGNFYLAADAAQLRAVERELVVLMERPAASRPRRVPVSSECLLGALLALLLALCSAALLRVEIP